MDPNFIVEVQPQQKWLDFKVVKMNSMVHFKDVGEFKIHEIGLANLFVTRSLETLIGTTVIGSGWPIYPRDAPAVLIEDGMLFVYDQAN